MATICSRLPLLSRVALISSITLFASLAACTSGTPCANGGAGAAGTAGAAGAAGAAGTGGRVPVKHRPEATACSRERLPSSCPSTAIPDAGAFVTCTQDTDCTSGANGRCDPSPRVNGCECSYDQCFADTDCTTAGGPCECRPQATARGQGFGPSATPTNVCKPGNCRVDQDCGAGGYCSPSLGPCGNYAGTVGYFCHTPQDKCVDDADCTTQGGGDCRFDQVGAAWVCQSSQCVG